MQVQALLASKDLRAALQPQADAFKHAGLRSWVQRAMHLISKYFKANLNPPFRLHVTVYLQALWEGTAPSQQASSFRSTDPTCLPLDKASSCHLPDWLADSIHSCTSASRCLTVRPLSALLH